MQEHNEYLDIVKMRLILGSQLDGHDRSCHHSFVEL